MKQAVQTLNKYYGDKRNPVADLGGYVLYIDNHTYFEVLYLLSSDYGIYVFMSGEIEKMIKNRIGR